MIRILIIIQGIALFLAYWLGYYRSELEGQECIHKILSAKENENN